MKHGARWAAATCVLVLGAGCAPTPPSARPPAPVTPYGSPAPLPSVDAGPDRLNLPYATDDSPAHKLDLYLPDVGAGPFPVVVFVHGGAWQFGSKDMPLSGKNGFGALRAMLQANGFAVASVQYRFVDAAPFPAQLHDVKAAVRYLRNHAGELGLDAGRIAIAGESAGGNLAELAGVTQGVADLEGNVGEPGSSAVRAVVSYYGVSDLTRVAADRAAAGCRTPANPANSGEWKLVGGDPTGAASETARRASPITYVPDAGTPTLLLHGTRDCVVPDAQSVRMNEALQAAGTPSQLITIPAGHADPGFYTDAALQASVLDFLRRHDA